MSSGNPQAANQVWIAPDAIPQEAVPEEALQAVIASAPELGDAVCRGQAAAVEFIRAKAISREAAGRMTHRQYREADAERQRLTQEGMGRELSPDELKRLKHAQAAVVGYLDYVFGPEDPKLAYAQVRPFPAHHRRKLGKAGRLGRLIHRR